MSLDDPCSHYAHGAPGIEPRWTRGAKSAVGTAYSTASHIWYTAAAGVITEIYYPHLDQPQIRDLQFLVTDGETFFDDERRHTESIIEPLSEHCLGARMVNEAKNGLYRLEKHVICDPHEATVLLKVTFEVDPSVADKLRLFVLCAPHIEGRGRGNSGTVVPIGDRKILTAHRGRFHAALAATVPFARVSTGFVGVTDGWTDLNDNFDLDFEFDCARDGNIALTGEIDRSSAESPERFTFTLGLALGDSRHNAVTTLLQSLATPFETHRETFCHQWARACSDLLQADEVTGDGGRLHHKSYSLLLGHEDKGYPGAMVAALSIPWGESKGDDAGLGGYHLVWTRDLVQSCTGLLSAGNTSTPLKALVYLSASQEPDGGFPQNFWLDGRPYWSGIQLDEVAFPVLLARHLHRRDALQLLDPMPMVRRAAAYLIRKGPVTPQERWEENGGYSPSTLASNIAALTVTATMLREQGDEDAAAFAQDYADFLEAHVEAWTVTTEGTLVEGIPRHYIRIQPEDPDNPEPDEDPNRGTLTLANRPPGERTEFPAKEIVDAGFLELVRYGIREAGTELMEDSLKVVDAVLKADTPHGPVWRRYNHDGYGQKQDGSPYDGSGVGRAWPLLTGERGHYELAAGRSAEPYLRTFESMAGESELLTEQVWDEDDIPDKFLFHGEPTGAAMPLCWSHAEYLKLVRSARDGQVFDCQPEVSARYLGDDGTGVPRPKLEIWKPNRRPRRVAPGWTLRVQAPRPFRLRWSTDDWQSAQDTDASTTSLGICWVDLPEAEEGQAPFRFTMFWTGEEEWEGRDYEVPVANWPGLL
jgi:glucoamylase